MAGPNTRRELLHETLERIFDLDARSGGHMRAYLGFGPERGEIDRFLRYALDLLSVVGRPLANQRVLDAGCGYGLLLVVCGFEGAETLAGIDIDPRAIEFANEYRRLLPGDIAGRLEIRSGDVMRLPFPDASFDVVTSIEAISHYLDVSQGLTEIGRVLRPGGALVISDGNNSRNGRYARMIRELWVAAEDGPGNRIIGTHAVGKPYRERREELIRELSPGLTDAQVSELAAATAGYVRGEIRDAVEAYDCGGTLPPAKRQEGGPPVDPDGATHERLFDPYELAGTLEEHGFDHVRVRGYWGGAGGRPAVRIANRFLAAGSRVSMRTAKGFRIRAIRRAQA
jgi:2-polyprenyl-3-methyl-5-hydroxy-6-metoxy-1,4-benzoquinol methylase